MRRFGSYRAAWVAGVLALFVLRHAGAAETMYPNDAQRELKEQIEETYGVYILNPSRRRAEEKVDVKGDTVEMWLYVDPRKPDYARIKCDALKWLLVGRFAKGGGQAFFARFSQFNNVDLNIFQMRSARTVDKDGNYTVSKSAFVTLRGRLSRKRADRIDWASAKQAYSKPEKTDKEVEVCVRNGEKLVDRFLYAKEYFK